MKDPLKKINQLTFTRFLAAIPVVFFHFGKHTAIFNNPYLHPFFSQANIGVSYFFVLSGFVMVVAYRNRKTTTSSYYKARFARLYPLYFFSLFFFVGVKKTIDFPGVIFSTMLIQSWIPDYALCLNYPGWSLSVEMFFYAAFPLILMFANKVRSIKTIFGITVTFFLFSQLIYHLLFHGGQMKNVPEEYWNYLPVLHLNEFITGAFGGFVFTKFKSILPSGPSNMILLLSLILLAVALLIKPAALSYHNGLLSWLFLFFILALALNEGIISSIFKSPPLVYLGEISYGVYILQVPVYFFSYTVLQWIGVSWSFNKFLLLLIFLAALCYHFIELPTKQFLMSRSIRSNNNSVDSTI